MISIFKHKHIPFKLILPYLVVGCDTDAQGLRDEWEV